MSGPDAIVALVVFGTGGSVAIILAKALAKKIAGGSPAHAQELEAMKDEVAQLRADMDDMRARVGDMDELQNRLDFTERVLGQIKNKPVLPGGSH